MLAHSCRICFRRRANLHLTFRRNFYVYDPFGLSFGGKMRLLVAPTLLTCSVGVGTFKIAETFKRQPSTEDKGKTPGRSLMEFNLVTGIASINIAVFSLWQLRNMPALRKFLNLYASACPHHISTSCRTLSMVGAMFSHKYIFHLIFNLAGLAFVANVISDPYQFTHVYVTGGLMAELGTYAHTLLAKPQPAVCSLGASGAIIAMFGYAMSMYRNQELPIPIINLLVPYFLPMDVIFAFLSGFSVCGLLLGTGRLDHAAHLSGLVYGVIDGEIKKRYEK